MASTYFPDLCFDRMAQADKTIRHQSPSDIVSSLAAVPDLRPSMENEHAEGDVAVELPDGFALILAIVFFYVMTIKDNNYITNRKTILKLYWTKQKIATKLYFKSKEH
uniref:Uncharacterized protein n=1 Tax=Oryza glaberrima TaxID=4538 RepID=I1PNZ7_ORYGL